MSEFLYVNGRLKRTQEQQESGDKYIAYSYDIDYYNSNYNDVYNVQQAINKLFEEIELLKNNNPNPPLEGQYTVSFNINGGTGTTPSPITAQMGKSVLLPTSAGFSRTGYNLYRWVTSTTTTATQYEPGKSYVFNKDIILYAKWTPKTYRVSFYSNGGTGTISDKFASYGGLISLPESSGFTREGYTFNSWNENSDGTGAIWHPGDLYTVTKDPTILYAIWVKDTTSYCYYVDTTPPTLSNYRNYVSPIPGTHDFKNLSGSRTYVYILVPNGKTISIKDKNIGAIITPVVYDENLIPDYIIYRTGTAIADRGEIVITLE